MDFLECKIKIAAHDFWTMLQTRVQCMLRLSVIRKIFVLCNLMKIILGRTIGKIKITILMVIGSRCFSMYQQGY